MLPGSIISPSPMYLGGMRPSFITHPGMIYQHPAFPFTADPDSLKHQKHTPPPPHSKPLDLSPGSKSASPQPHYYGNHRLRHSMTSQSPSPRDRSTSPVRESSPKSDIKENRDLKFGISAILGGQSESNSRDDKTGNLYSLLFNWLHH